MVCLMVRLSLSLCTVGVCDCNVCVCMCVTERVLHRNTEHHRSHRELFVWAHRP